MRRSPSDADTLALFPKGTRELVLIEWLTVQHSFSGGRLNLLLEQVHMEGGGLVSAHLGFLLATGCLEEGCISLRPSQFKMLNKQSAPCSDFQFGLCLTEFGGAVLPYYLTSTEKECTKIRLVRKLVLALRHMAERPIWKTHEGELWWRGTLVKRFRNDAAEQRCVLDAFQESGWISCRENPFTFRNGASRKARLRNTVKDLNRSQHPQRIHFRCNGRGGIRWELKI